MSNLHESQVCNSSPMLSSTGQLSLRDGGDGTAADETLGWQMLNILLGITTSNLIYLQSLPCFNWESGSDELQKCLPT